MERRQLRTGWVALLLVVAATVALLVLRDSGMAPKDVAAVVEAVGERWWAPLLFMALYLVFNVFLLPATVLTLTAGVVWGGLTGGLWVLAASTVASAVPYLIGRSGSGVVERVLRGRADGLQEKLRKEGFITLLLMRLIPIVPYNVLNYAAGLAAIRPRHYFAATFLGTIPGIFIFTYLASSIAAGLISPRDAFLRILIAGMLLASITLVTRYSAKRLKARITEE